MKPIYKIPFVFLIPLAILLYANSTGSIGGKTGSPGDGATCVECHIGSPNPITGWISSNIPTEGYTPGQTYQITATGTHNGVVRFGFELTAENTSGSKVGTFIITDPTRTKLTNINNAVTHTFNGITPTGNTNSWSMNWTAPPNDIGQVRFYAAFNAANGDNNTTGDVIYTSNLFIDAAQPPALLSVVPDEAEQGSSPGLTISAENTSWLGSSPDVRLRNVSGPSEIIIAENVSVTNNTQLIADFNIPPDASPGLWDVLVDDLELEAAFTIIEIFPALLSVVPDMAAQGDMVELSITAENTFWIGSQPEVNLTFDGSLPTIIEAIGVEVINNTLLVAAFEIPIDATVGLYDLHVDDLILPSAFTVTLLNALSQQSAQQAKVYPNPATDRVWVESEAELQLRFYDMSGKLVLEQHTAPGRSSIQLNGLERGVYILESNGLTRKTERLIIR